MALSPASPNPNNDLEHGPTMFVGTMPYMNDSRYTTEDIYKAISLNLKAGIRHIDTAELYEEALPCVQRALKDSKVRRHDLFVTSKLRGMPMGRYKSNETRLKTHMEKLGVKYLDLLLIHWPGEPEVDLNAAPETVAQQLHWATFDESIDHAWEIMQQFKENGLVRHIGISNFYRQHLERLLSSKVCHVRPYANQIYLDATQHKLEYVQNLQKEGIHVIAYRPLEFLPALKIAGEMGDTVYKALARILKQCNQGVDTVHQIKTIQQLILAWLLKRGISVCVKSCHYHHVKENVAAQEKVHLITDEISEVFPVASQLSLMLLAYDAYAQVFESS